MVLVSFADHHHFNSLLHDTLNEQKNWHAVMISFQCENGVYSAIVLEHDRLTTDSRTLSLAG